MISKATSVAAIAILLMAHASSYAVVHAILDKLEKYEIHKLSDHSHMNNARNGRKLMQSRGERRLSYEFEAFGRVLALELTRDDELFAPDYKHYFVVPKDDGSHEYIVDENVDTKCHYKAIIKDDPQSMGRVSLCGPGMRAMFRHSEIGQFHIEPIDDKGDEHAVYRSLDAKNTNKNKCGVDDSHNVNANTGGPNNGADEYTTSTTDSSSSKRSLDDIMHHNHDHDHDHDHQHDHDEKQGYERRRLVNLPDKLVRLMIVNDVTRYKQMGSAVHTHAASLVAIMDTIYSTLGGDYTFKMQIVGMMTFSIKDPFTVPIESTGYPTANNILNLFTSWAAANANSVNFPVQYSHAMMFSGYNFDGPTVGLAWVANVCYALNKFSITQTINLIDARIAAVAAHELGHNLGMRHDDTSDPDSLVPTACFNSSSQHVMDPILSPDGKAPWSTCSPNWVKMNLEGYNTKYPKRYDATNYPACMEKCYIGDPNPPTGCVGVATRDPSTPVCGDGLREGSEECDCPNKDCTNVDPCCDGATCTLKSTSQCSLLDSCCSSTCQIVPANTQVCRAATGECDVSEMCNGISSICPPDDFLQIGSPCTVYSKAGTCYNKVCLSHYGQCTDTGGLGAYDSGCPTRDFDNGDASCGNLYCRPTGQTGCVYYPTVDVKDGTQCSSNKACMNKVCTPYSSFPNQPTTTVSPTKNPTKTPTVTPTISPTKAPTVAPVTPNPTFKPSLNPTNAPTTSPTSNPTVSPTQKPSNSPTLPTQTPTNSPTLSVPGSPTVKPSISPSSAPVTLAPTTKTPTSNPTLLPSKNPTTRTPTKNPTRKTTSSFFTSTVSVQAFNLYLLIDATRGYELINNYCVGYKLMSGALPSSCFDLLMDYAIEIVKSISSSIGYYSNDLSKGLRVQASIIKCVGSLKDPGVVSIFALTGDSSVIMNGLNNARTSTTLDVVGTCPIRGVYQAMQKVEDTWNDIVSRPYKAIITLTDAQLNDASGTTGTAVINAVSAIRYRCTPSLVVIPYKITGTSPQALTQQLSLKILTGNIDSSVFEAKDAPWIVIPKIGEQITTLLSTSNARCTVQSSFSTVDKYWCGYNHPTICTPRTSCEWLLTPTKTCSKIALQSGCNFNDQTSCTSNTQCQWNSSTSKCTRKAEVPDCNAYFTSTLCGSRPNFCSWNGSQCVALSG